MKRTALQEIKKDNLYKSSVICRLSLKIYKLQRNLQLFQFLPYINHSFYKDVVDNKDSLIHFRHLVQSNFVRIRSNQLKMIGFITNSCSGTILFQNTEKFEQISDSFITLTHLRSFSINNEDN